MTLSIVKNESDATKRIGYAISVLNEDGQLIDTNPTFTHGTAVSGVSGVVKEVEIWNGTDWVEAAANPTEIKGATGTVSGLFQYQFAQAETNHDGFAGVRLCKTGYARPFYLPLVPITASSVGGSTGTPQCSHLLSPFLIELEDEQPIYFKVFDVNGEPATGEAANMDGFLSMDNGGSAASTGAFSEVSAGDLPGVYVYTPGADELGTVGGAVLQVHNTFGEPAWDDFSVGFQIVGAGVGIESETSPDDILDDLAVVDGLIDALTLAVADLPEDTATETWDGVTIEGSSTPADFLRVIASGIFGKVTNFLTNTLVFKGVIDTAKTRQTVTTNSTGRVASAQGDWT